MVIIRLARGGAKKRPFYRIAVADRRSPRDGKYIEVIGFYNPTACGQEVKLKLNMERLNHWISQGGQPSKRVEQLAKDYAKQTSDEKAA